MSDKQTDGDEISFGEQLRRLREAAGLTQEQLAERAGMSAKGISALERGERQRPYLQTVDALAEALGLDANKRLQLLNRVPPRTGPGREASVEPDDGLPLFAPTKLYAPRPRINLLHRQRLAALVQTAMGQARILLLSAPAGSGKTTLLASTLAAGSSRGHIDPEAGPRLAWISLDEEDNEPFRFWLLLCAAIDRLAPGAARQARTLLRGGNPLDGMEAAERGRQIVGALLNGIHAVEGQNDGSEWEYAHPSTTEIGHIDRREYDDDTLGTGPHSLGHARRILVLDDLHVIHEAGLFAGLTYLAERLPDSILLVLATRHDPPLPLARFRVRQELVEIRLPQLRFSAEETAAWLGQRLGSTLAQVEIEDLHRRAEGWAAGIGLLVSSLESLETPAARENFLRRFAQRDRYLFDYLADEIFNRQTDEVREFLLACSILPVLTPDRCAAVTQRADAAALLNLLYQRNLFLVALDLPDGSSAYRFHDLFGAFLRANLAAEPEAVAREYHRRAAQVETDPNQRVRHWIGAHEWAACVAEILRYAGQMLAAGGNRHVQSWIEALPREVVEAEPWLAYWMGMCHWQEFNLAIGQQHFRRALAGFEAENDVGGQEQVRAWIAVGLSYWDDLAAAGEWAAAELARPLPPALRAQILVAYSMGQMLNEEGAAATDSLNVALTLVESSHDPAVLATIVRGVQAPHAVLPGGGRCVRAAHPAYGTLSPARYAPVYL